MTVLSGVSAEGEHMQAHFSTQQLVIEDDLVSSTGLIM